MTNAKSERLVNLCILLLSARNFVSRRQIRETIEGYRRQGDEAFARMFERDKEELRAVGIPIVTGSNDPDSDEQDGYRIIRSDFELPPIEFSPGELAVLGLANFVWQDSVAARLTSEALETLRAAGVVADPLGTRTLLPSIGAEPGLDELLAAIHERRRVTFDYRGEARRVEPWRLQQRLGRWYLLGRDMDRDAPRHFKLSRLTSAVRPVGRPGTYGVPAPDVLVAIGLADPQAEAITALVGVRHGRGRDLVRGAPEQVWPGELPEGFVVFRISRPFPEGIVGEVCALGPDAVLLEPPELRSQVVARLRHVAGAWAG